MLKLKKKTFVNNEYTFAFHKYLTKKKYVEYELKFYMSCD